MPHTILLVDDEPMIRKLVHATLDGDEYRILQAASAEEAIKVLDGESIDLVLLDWNMPGLSGIELTRQFRAAPTTADLPIIMLTTNSRSEDRATGQDAGVTTYLTKPFSPLELIRCVEQILDSDSA